MPACSEVWIFWIGWGWSARRNHSGSRCFKGGCLATCQISRVLQKRSLKVQSWAPKTLILTPETLSMVDFCQCNTCFVTASSSTSSFFPPRDERPNSRQLPGRLTFVFFFFFFSGVLAYHGISTFWKYVAFEMNNLSISSSTLSSKVFSGIPSGIHSNTCSRI